MLRLMERTILGGFDGHDEAPRVSGTIEILTLHRAGLDKAEIARLGRFAPSMVQGRINYYARTRKERGPEGPRSPNSDETL